MSDTLHAAGSEQGAQCVPDLPDCVADIVRPFLWDYEPAQLRAYLKLHKLSVDAAANKLDVSTRSIRSWLSNSDVSSARPMPYGMWVALVALTTY